MASGRQQRRKYTVSQAKNLMRRAVDEIVDPGPRSVDSLWEYFDARCAYCRRELSRDRREGHVDHADAAGGNHLGNLVLACGSCNGDEKREESWRDFLHAKTADDVEFAERESRILGWFALHSRSERRHSVEVARVRTEIEGLIDQFAAKCGELKTLVSEPDRVREGTE